MLYSLFFGDHSRNALETYGYVPVVPPHLVEQSIGRLITAILPDVRFSDGIIRHDMLAPPSIFTRLWKIQIL